MRLLRLFVGVFCLMARLQAQVDPSVPQFGRPFPLSDLDPRGTIHIPIGAANTVDALKTFVEGEGNFSPGFGSYGIYFWVWDGASQGLIAPTMHGMTASRSLPRDGTLAPASTWDANGISVRSEVCQVALDTGGGVTHVAGVRVSLKNATGERRKFAFYAALRSVGAAGWPVWQMAAEGGNALLVEGRTALVGHTAPSRFGVLPDDSIVEVAKEGRTPHFPTAVSKEGHASGALVYDLTLGPGESVKLGFVCPVLAGRRVVGHEWDGVSEWAQYDLAPLSPSDGVDPQKDFGLQYYQSLNPEDLFARSSRYFRELLGKPSLNLPDARWNQAFKVLTAHVSMNMNEGAPDVAAVNYNVYNRDGVYIANILQKSGQFRLAEKAIDYFLKHPFNGRAEPEADNPGQILWIVGQHWRFTHDELWLRRVYPSIEKLAWMIAYYRASPPPHFVSMNSLEFGSDLEIKERKILKPGSCDGYHPEYTEAWDVAGLREATALALVMGRGADAGGWSRLAESFFSKYDQKFGADLARGYGSYAVLWPCRLYPLGQGSAQDQFMRLGAQQPTGWRYFPLARAHQSLLAGNREAGFSTINQHLDHEQMRGWFAFDEGGESGTGGWNKVLTTWKQGRDSVAMPHGWSIAEVQLLLRDSLLFETEDSLVLGAGMPAEWFRAGMAWGWTNVPTHFGSLSVQFDGRGAKPKLVLAGGVRPEDGVILKWPKEVHATLSVGGKPLVPLPNGDYVLPAKTRVVMIGYEEIAARPRPKITPLRGS